MSDEEIEDEVLRAWQESEDREEERKKAEARRCAMYREVFNSPEGENVLEDLRRQCQAGEWEVSHYDPNKALVQKGMQSMYWWIQSRLKGDE